MRDYRYLDHDFEFARYLVKCEPNHVFEYEKTAYEMAEQVNGEVVELYLTSYTTLYAVDEKDMHFIGYGVLKGESLL